MLPNVDAREIEISLTKSKEGRTLARDTQRQLARLQTTPIAELHSLAAASDPLSETARIWLRLTREHFDTIGREYSGNEVEQFATSVESIDVGVNESRQQSEYIRSVDIWSIIAALRDSGLT